MALRNQRIGPPEIFGQPPRTERGWFDLLAATTAILLSVISLVVSFRGERTQKGLLAANSWPFLQLSKDQSDDFAKLEVENEGVGPAKIYSFEVFYQGRSVPSVTALLQQCCSPGQSTSGGGGTSFGAIGFGSVSDNVLRPGEHITALRIRKTKPDEAMLSRFSAALPDITFRACYCSVLSECWTGNMETLAQIAVRSCPAVLHSFTYGDRRNP